MVKSCANIIRKITLWVTTTTTTAMSSEFDVAVSSKNKIEHIVNTWLMRKMFAPLVLVFPSSSSNDESDCANKEFIEHIFGSGYEAWTSAR